MRIRIVLFGYSARRMERREGGNIHRRAAENTEEGVWIGRDDAWSIWGQFANENGIVFSLRSLRLGGEMYLSWIGTRGES